MNGVTRQVSSAMVWSVFARAARFVLGLASSVIVVRSLGENDYGVLSLVRTMLMYVLVMAGSGLGPALLKYLPDLRVQRSADGARSLIRMVVGANLVIWAVLVTAAFFGRGLVERAFDFDGFGVILSASVALALFELLFTIVSQVLNARYDTRLLSIASVASHAVYIAALVVVLPRGWGVLGVVAAAAAGNAVACVIVAGKLRTPDTRGPEGADVPAAPEARIPGARLARFSIPFAAIGLLNLVIWRQSETLFLAHFRTAAETGFFDLAYRMPQTMLEFVPGTVWPLVMAGFSEVYSRNPADAARAIDRYYRMLFLLCAPICVIGVTLGGKMIPILFGEAMAPAAVPTQVFFGVLTVSFLATPLSMSLYVMEKTHVNLIVYVCLAAVNVGLDLALIPRFGVAGAVLPVALVIAASPFVYRAVVGRYMPDVRIPLRFIGRCFAASSAALLLVPFLRYVDGGPELLAAAVAATLLVGIAFRVLRVIGREEARILEMVPFANRILKLIAS